VTEERLVYMANQIATFFRSAPRPEAVASTLDHIKKFWEPRMRRRIIGHLAAAKGEGLNEIALAAIEELAAAEAAQGKLPA
jgi:formate dehydrogenase subunit delta